MNFFRGFIIVAIYANNWNVRGVNKLLSLTIISLLVLSAISLTSNLGNSETNNNQNLSTSPRAAPLVYIGPNQTGAGKFGEVVAYNLTVTNSQGVADYIDITYKSEPNGLSVNLFEADGKTLLKDSDSDGDPDTGLLGVSQSVDIAVKVTIPGDKYINEPEKTTVLATTSASPSDPGCEAILTTEVKPFLDITQTANPETIFIQSAETYNLTTKSRITLNVSGGGLPITAGLPLDIVLTLDNSGSMNGQPINDLVTAANNFVDKLTDEDRVAIYCFDGGGWPGFPAWPHLLLDWTFMDAAGKTQAHNMINTLLGNSNYYTPIWDTIHDAIEKASTPLQDHKPLVIAMTDGENTRNNYGLTPPQGPWPLYDNDGNTGDDWIAPPAYRGLCEAPLTVFTIGLGINPGSVQEDQLTEIALSSNPRGEYYYAPTSSELDDIYDSIAKKIMNVSGEDPDPSDNKPMMTYVLPDYIEFVQGSFRIGPNSIETNPTPDKINYNPSNTTFEWDVDVIYINESWVVSFEITSTKAGWIPINLYPDSNVFYTNPIFPNITIPFPEVWIEALPLPDLAPTDILINDLPYPIQDEVVNITIGEKLKISSRVRNLGAVNTNRFSDHFNLTFYNSSQISAPFYETEISSIELLKISESYSGYWPSPDYLGICKLIIFVDASDLIPEGPEAEKNNKFNISIQVNEAPFVDLIPTNIVIDETPYDETYINISLEVEQQIELEARAKNIGNVETTFYAPNFHIAYYDSLTPLTPFLNEVVNSLEPEDKTSPYTASWKAPSVPGIYEVILFVDSTDVIPEGGLNAENNNKIHIFMNVTKEPLIDLILTNIKINDVLYSTRITSSVNTTNDTIIIIDLVTGQPIKISTQILNLGDTDTEEFSPEFYISYYNGTTIQSFEDDSFLHKSVKSSSPQNLSANYISNWTAPLTPGIYILNLFVDSTDLIPEGIALEYENNNKIELEFFVHELPLPPSPELDVSDEDVEIYWDDTSEVEYYNVYGGQTPDTIDFNLELGKTSKNYWAHGAWLDEYDEYYYVVRSIGKYEWMGTTSDIIGFKTIKFQRGYNTFSLPLEPFTAQSADWYLDEMFKSKSESGDIYKYDTTQQKWVGHPKGLPVGINDFNLLVGRTYMLYTSKDIEYTFVGRPGTTIKYIDGIEADPRIGTDPEFRNGLEITLSFEGVKLNWKPAMNLNKFEKADHYNIYRSNLRHGFNFSNLIHSTPWTSPELTSFMDTSIIDQVGAYYYLVAPVSPIGRVGSSTFSVGVVIRTYSRGYSGFALPLRLTTNVSVVHFEGSYNYSDEDLGKIDYLAFIDTIYYYNNSMQKWIGVPRLLPAELKHLQIVNYDGYLIYLAIKNVKLCFIGR